jgi:hypothetical protein
MGGWRPDAESTGADAQRLRGPDKDVGGLLQAGAVLGQPPQLRVFLSGPAARVAGQAELAGAGGDRPCGAAGQVGGDRGAGQPLCVAGAQSAVLVGLNRPEFSGDPGGWVQATAACPS